MIILKNILDDIKIEKKSIVVTLPSNIDWNVYETELLKVKNYDDVINFKVFTFPENIKKGDKCYIAHNGYVKGWIEIVGFIEKKFKCDGTDKECTGKYIERSGPFHYINKLIPIKDFKGFRYFSEKDF